MSLDNDNKAAAPALQDKTPEFVKRKFEQFKTQFLAAKRPTQAGIVAAAALLLYLVFGTGSNNAGLSSVTFEARRGDLDITVLEGGALEAMQSQEIRSRVKGREGAKILSIVEEGYRVTVADVTAGLVLVELDTSSLIDQQLNQEISVETAEASFIERRAQFEIQINQNMTDLNNAKQDMKFARLDFEKFLGANVVNTLVADLQIEERLAEAEAAEQQRQAAESAAAAPQVASQQQPNARGGRGGFDPANFDPNNLDALPEQMRDRIRQMMADNGGEMPQEMLDRMRRGGRGGQDSGQGSGQDFEAPVTREPVAELTLQPLGSESMNTTSSLLMNEEYMVVRDSIDFSVYADMEILEDGEAKQSLRSLEDDLQVAQGEFLLATDRVEGQRRLQARDFITPTELEAEELNLNKSNNKREEKQTARMLYIQYTFPKRAEELLAGYENAVMGYQRQLIENIAELAQQQARFKSAERKYNLERVKLADLNEQIELATIRADTPGLVVYGAADQNSSRFRGGSSQEAIQEGATVRERQPILTIPDMREMSVKVNIHESAVQRVAIGQRVKVTIDAFPGVLLEGEVVKVAVVADSANAFMNPDLKVYPTVVKIDGTHDWLRPGMSSEVEILVTTLTDVVYVPLQAVTYFDDVQVVYLANGSRREIEVGSFSEQFIEVVSGLQAGDDVLLLPPQQTISNADS